MVLTNFKIRISDLAERKYKPRSRKVNKIPVEPRTLFSFTLEWEGCLSDEDPLSKKSYVGAEHKGCMLYAAGNDLGWGFAKVTTFRGHQIVPSKPNTGLHDLVLAALSERPEAQVIRDEIAHLNAARIPDPEAPVKEYMVIE